MEALVEELSTKEENNVEKFADVATAGGLVYSFCKRVLDLLIAVIAFLFCLLPMIVIGILVKLDSEGPVIYAQERLGKYGKPFMIYKFRSMVLTAEADGPKWADADDKRCTKVGRFLRKSRLDEIPQLINILKGEMSFVGPRPERAYFYDKFESYIPGFWKRMAVVPGLTGLAQVNGGYDLSPEEKLSYDMEYIQKRSFWMDMKCMVKTARLIFTHEGAR